MNKTEFVNRIAENKELSKKEALEIVEMVFEEVTDVLTEGEEVSIHGFGKFEVRDRAERMGINPKTKEPMKIEASKTVGFKVKKALKDAINA